jgi:hypothetical protein
MNTTPTRPGSKPDIDDETRRILEERLLTIEADEKDSVGRETGREEIRKLRQSLKHSVLR